MRYRHRGTQRYKKSGELDRATGIFYQRCWLEKSMLKRMLDIIGRRLSRVCLVYRAGLLATRSGGVLMLVGLGEFSNLTYCISKTGNKLTYLKLKAEAKNVETFSDSILNSCRKD